MIGVIGVLRQLGKQLRTDNYLTLCVCNEYCDIIVWFRRFIWIQHKIPNIKKMLKLLFEIYFAAELHSAIQFNTIHITTNENSSGYVRWCPFVSLLIVAYHPQTSQMDVVNHRKWMTINFFLQCFCVCLVVIFVIFNHIKCA